MKKYLSLIVFVVGAVAFGVNKISPVVFPPEAPAVLSINVYPTYLVKFQKSVPIIDEIFELTLRPDHTAYVFEPNFQPQQQKIGLWTTLNDTLLIYMKWDDSEKPFLLQDSIDMNYLSTPYFYRNAYDTTFPRNVAAFKIINNGDSLLAISDESEHVGIPISRKAANETHKELLPAFFECYQRKEDIKKAEPGIKWEDTLVWKPEAMPESNRFVVEDIGRDRFNSIIVRANNSGIAFNILNPRRYPQAEARPFATRPEYTAWFDSVTVGDTIALALSRPAYHQAVFDRSPYLRGYPDSVYVMDHEAYGYWFARPAADPQ